MAGVCRTKDKNGKPYPNWRFWFMNYRGEREWGTGTPRRDQTLRMAQKLEQDHREVRLGYRPAPMDSARDTKPFDEAVEEYLAWGETQGGRGGRPWGKTHAASRRRHLPFWRDRLGVRQVRDLEGTLARVERILRQLRAEGRSGKTLANYAESLRAFTDWCLDRGYLDEHPLKGLGGFDTTPQTQRRALTQDEVARLLHAAPKERRLLYAVAMSTGLRARELASLRVRHLDLENGGLRLDAAWTKNRKPGFQSVPRGLLEQVQAAVAG